MFEPKKVLVVGLGKSGFAMMNVLYDRGYTVEVYDGKEKDKVQDLMWITSHSHRQFFAEVPDVSRYDLIALSPGVPPDLDWLEAARRQGIPVWGEIEWAYRLAKGPFFGITGTNGKTTTTQLTYEIMDSFYEPVELVGNIGIPAVERAARAQEGTRFVAEISSFQLETIETFKVQIGAILNLTPDHLNRHGTMELYVQAKYRIFENLEPTGHRILNYDDALLRAYGEEFDNTFFFSRQSALDRGCCIEDGSIVIKDGGRQEVLRVDEIGIPGDHNVENVLAAVSIAHLAGVPAEVIAKAVRAFKGVEHRLEIFENKLGRVFINDSKATNPDATIKAIESMEQPTVLLAGGMDKGSDYSEMIDLFRPHIRAMVVYGETKKDLESAAAKAGFTQVQVVNDLEEAVEAAMALSEEGYAILLSPACASWDMYPNFEVRGRHFKEIVSKLG